MRPLPILALAAAALIAGSAGFLLHRAQATPAAKTAASGAQLPANIALTDLEGHSHALSEWHGKLLLINFWATWCGPCLKEIPLLVRTQKKYAGRGLQIIGPAIDDPDEVRKLALGPLAIGYPVMVGTPDQMIGLLGDFGNSAGALPFTVVVAPDGSVIHQELGEYGAEELTALIEQHLPR